MEGVRNHSCSVIPVFLFTFFFSFQMQEFYKALPQYKNLDFFIFGESYAGHYVPAVSHYIWQKNQGDATAQKTLLLSIESWLVNRDPYFMVYEIIPI